MRVFLIALSLISQSFISLNVSAADSSQLASAFSKVQDPLAKYNGITGQAPIEDPLKLAEYNQKNLDLTAIIWADTEISQKLCKPLGNEKPKSYTDWWAAVNKYVASEKLRNTRILFKQEELSKKVEALKASNKLGIQTESLKIQIEALNIAIDSISGSSLSTDGSSSVESASRLAAREELLVNAVIAQENSLVEDKNMTVAYENCLNGVEKSSAIATEACASSSIKCARTKSVCEEDVCTTVADPVPGSCELKSVSCPMAQTSLPLFKRISLPDLQKLYTIAPIPSKQINERLLKLLNLMDQQINILYSKSTDANFDWTTPLQACLAPIEKIAKANGVMCPSDSKAGKDFDQSTFDHLGRSTDFFAESSRLIVNQTATAGTPSYLDAKNFFTGRLESLTKDPANNLKSPKELENMALANLWQNYFVTSPYTQNFLAGRPHSYGLDPADEQRYAKEVMVRNNETDYVCNSRNCQTPIAPPPIVRIIIPEYAKVTESAKVFLDAAGIKDSLGQEMGVYLSDKWNNSDLSIGQSHNRKFYFKYIQELIKPLLASDQNKLSALLINRNKLINSYEALMRSLNKGVTVANVNNTQNIKTTNTLELDKQSTTNITPNPNTTDLALSGKGDLMNNNPMNLKNLENDLQQASGGRMSFRTAILSSNGNGNGIGSAKAIKAIEYSKNVNDRINKSLSKIAGFKNKATKDQLNDENKSFEAFSKKMASTISPKSAAAASSLLFSAGSSDNSGSSNLQEKPATEGFTATQASQNALAYSNNQRSFPTGSAYTRSAYTRSQNSVDSNTNENSNSMLASAMAGTQKEISEDQQRILDAIKARNRTNAHYPDENDSIFSRITKAYIRSYDKLK